MTVPQLSPAFVTALSPEAQEIARQCADLESRLQELVRLAERASPGIVAVPTEFAAHVGAHLKPGTDTATALDGVNGADLWLAFACSRGDQRAIGVLEQRYGRQIEAALAGMRDKHLLPEDFRQILRRKLFVGSDGSNPAIAQYSGHGPLGAWLRVTATRTGLNAIRGKKVETTALPDSDDLFGLPPSLPDPELDYLRHNYQEAFRAAFLQAVEELPPRPRTLLKLSVVDRLSVREIGRMYGTHHATAARWIAQARELLISGTRDNLMKRLDISQRELQSIMGLIQSRLEVSIIRVLKDDDSS